MAKKYGKRKRSYKRKSKAGYRSTYISRGVSTGLPKMMTVKHKYNETIQLNSVGGALTTYQYSCNGMYDPRVAIGGHQPYLFDQMVVLYNHYTVIGSKITVDLINRSTDEANILALYIDDDAVITSPGGMANLKERGSAKLINTSYGSNKTKRITHNWSMKKAFGAGGSLANSLLRGSASANPTEVQNFTIAIQAADTVSTTALFGDITVEYIAVWNELADIGSS